MIMQVNQFFLNGQKIWELATENTQMASKHIKRYLTYACIWNIEIKTK